MRPIFSPLLFMLLFAASSLAHAQEPGSTPQRFSESAISRALADLPAHFQSPLDPRSDWSHVRQLAATTEIVLSARGMMFRKCRFLSASDTILTVVDLEDVNRATLQIPRDDVTEIRRWTGRRGSPIGAVLGAAGGFALGFLSAVSLAFRQCGDSCADERLLIGFSLVGMPIGGGLAGYYLFRKDRTLTTIYLKP